MTTTDATRLEPGQPAPSLDLIDDSGARVSLQDFAGKHVIVYFYPAAMTPGCTTEACDFRDNIESLAAAGYVVLGVSKDQPEKLAKFRQRDGLNFPLLSDPSLEAHKPWGAYGEKKLYGKVHVGTLRSTIVVGPDGTVELARYNVRAKGHVASLRKALGLAA